MAAEIEGELGILAQLVSGSRGAFDVEVDGVVVFSKGELHRFPDPGEITALIRERLG